MIKKIRELNAKSILVLLLCIGIMGVGYLALLDYINPLARVNFTPYTPTNTKIFNEQVVISDFKKVSFNPFEKREVKVAFWSTEGLAAFFEESRATDEVSCEGRAGCRELVASDGQQFVFVSKEEDGYVTETVEFVKGDTYIKGLLYRTGRDRGGEGFWSSYIATFKSHSVWEIKSVFPELWYLV